MGLCGMFLVLYPRNTVQVFWDEGALMLSNQGWINDVPGWGVVVAFVAFDLYGMIIDRGSNIGYAAHLIGCLLGAGLAVGLLKAGRLKPDVGEQNLLQWWAGEGPVERKPRRRGRKEQLTPEEKTA
jgi:membrane associated rhomboid family serine protease